MKFYVIIPASGSGVRYGSKLPKQFIRIDGKEIIAYTLQKFNSLKSVDSIVIATQKKYINKLRKLVRENKFYKVCNIVEGGKTRHDSVLNGLKALRPDKNDFIIVHDAVRPFITVKKIRELMKEVKDCNAVIPGLRINDTTKKVSRNNIILKTIPRENLWIVQTPQLFRYDILKKAFKKADENKFKGTDESSIVEYAGYKVKIIEGEKTNVKITTKEDIMSLDIKELLKN
jgi:2-C-methyl-D-erythritol 4-phosphate cytidylyltransferase